MFIYVNTCTMVLFVSGRAPRHLVSVKPIISNHHLLATVTTIFRLRLAARRPPHRIYILTF